MSVNVAEWRSDFQSCGGLSEVALFELTAQPLRERDLGIRRELRRRLVAVRVGICDVQHDEQVNAYGVPSDKDIAKTITCGKLSVSG